MSSRASFSSRGSRDRLASRLPLVLYLAAIVAPTVTILGLGLRAVGQQRHAFESLAEAKRRTTETAAATQIETRVESLAASCLDDPRLAAIDEDADWRTPEQVGATRHLLESVAHDHRIARYLFVIRDGNVVVPRVGVMLPDVDGLLSRAGSSRGTGTAEQFARADGLEREGRFMAAVDEYRRVLLVRSQTLNDDVGCDRRQRRGQRRSARHSDLLPAQDGRPGDRHAIAN